MIIIVSGPSCVGKSFFIKNKFEYYVSKIDISGADSITQFNPEMAGRNRSDFKVAVWDKFEELLQQSDDKVISVHYDIVLRRRQSQKNHEYYTKKISELKTSKKVSLGSKWDTSEQYDLATTTSQDYFN